jgi:hypothetical protein
MDLYRSLIVKDGDVGPAVRRVSQTETDIKEV